MGKKDKIDHILVVRLSAMGDVAMLVPCISRFIEKYPSVKVTILTRKRFEPIFEGIPNISVFAAEVKNEHKGFLGLFRLYKQLSKLQIDAVADTHNVLRSTILKLFFRIGGTPFIQIDKGRKEKKQLVRERNKVFKPLKATHQRYADVFEKLGFPIELSTDKRLEKAPLSEELAAIARKASFTIGTAPFAAHKSKMYPLVLMEEVIKKIAEHSEIKVLLFGGGKEETEKLDAVANKLGDNVVNVAGKLSFKDELALISNLDVMLGMDSGNGHLATNYGVPVITLWGVTHPYAGFAPFGQPVENSLCADRNQYPLIPTSIYGNKYPEGYDRAMETIAPESVYKRLVEILDLN